MEILKKKKKGYPTGRRGKTQFNVFCAPSAPKKVKKQEERRGSARIKGGGSFKVRECGIFGGKNQVWAAACRRLGKKN